MSKAGLVGSVALLVLAADAFTKWLVQQTFYLGQSVPVLGDAFRFTYVLNPGAAFGLHVGEHSRIVFGVLATVAAVIIAGIIRHTPGSQRAHLFSLALILGGAVGNLVDRVRHPGGVVDFLDVGLGAFRWPVFNIADVGVTSGAFLLVVLLWGEGAEVEEPEPARVRAERSEEAPESFAS